MLLNLVRLAWKDREQLYFVSNRADEVGRVGCLAAMASYIVIGCRAGLRFAP